MAYTIKEVEKKTGISSHTIRFWAKSGLFPSVERAGAASVRYFSEADLGWVAIVHCLRQSGLSLEAVKKYIDLCFQGESTLEERLEILKAQRDETLKIMQDYQKALDKLNSKVEYYEKEIIRVYGGAKNRERKSAQDKLNPNAKESRLKRYFDNVQGYERMGENAGKRLAK